MRKILSDNEQIRASKFHFQKDEFAYIVARSGLRRIISRYLDIAPTAINFIYNKYGKPALEERQNYLDLKFNLSHSAKISIYAITKGRKIGVDVEFIRDDFADIEIAKKFFSACEIKRLKELRGRERTVAFFKCWTRKEAFIKAIGHGLSIPLDSFDVSLAPDEPAELVGIRYNSIQKEQWELVDFEPENNYAAAVAAEMKIKSLKWLRLMPE